MKNKLSREQIRKKYWYINFILSRFTALYKRDKYLWVFSAWEGNQYEDNSRYLFEHINRNHKEIKAVWLSENKDIVNEIRDHGYTAYISSSAEGKSIQRSAGVVFYTHGIDDISDISYVYGAKIVALWHGIINKKGYYYDCTANNMSLRNKLRLIKKACYSQINRDITICSSEYDKKTIAETFHILPKNIIITGYPRNDALKEQRSISDVVLNISVPQNAKILLYMPTFRPYTSGVIEECIKDMDQYLCDQNNHLPTDVYIIVKLHYLTHIDYKPLNKRLLILTGKDITSVQDLLVASRCLITDYSSVCVDFSIMHKPVGLYAPDIEEYCEKNGITEYWKALCMKNAFFDKEKLLEFLRFNLIENKLTYSVCEDIVKHYEAEEISGTCFSENVYQRIVSGRETSYAK